MIKCLTKVKYIQASASFLASFYLRAVNATTHFLQEPEDFHPRELELPAIFALWHAHNLMAHCAQLRLDLTLCALTSRHSDGEMNARVLKLLGVEVIRGSGGSLKKSARKGGISALRTMARTLAAGKSVAITADVYKQPRRAGLGIVHLAKISGRPVYPLAVISKNSFELNTWDRMHIGKLFGKGAIVFGPPLFLPQSADVDKCADFRNKLEIALNHAHARAYALAGSQDPHSLYTLIP